MVDVALVAGLPVEALEGDGRVAVVPVMILEDDSHPVVGREIRATVGVAWVGRFRERQEPLRMLHDPARVDAHVVGDHVAGEADAACPGAVAQVRVCALATEIPGDPIVVEGIGRGHGSGVASHPLDLLRRLGALPKADQPQAGDAPPSERFQLLIRDGIERPDIAPIGA